LDLYGEEVLPPELLDVKNRDLSAMEHVSRPGGVSESEAIKEMAHVLCRLVLIAQERPVVTRFFYLRHVVSQRCVCSFLACRSMLSRLVVCRLKLRTPRELLR
jgi:hypothetical protein